MLDSLFAAAEVWARRRAQRGSAEHTSEKDAGIFEAGVYDIGVVEDAAAPGAFEPRRYCVTVDARPHERRDGGWVIGETTVRIRFYCSATTHVLCWPDYCTFSSRYDAERDAYVAGLRWARARYG